MVLVKKMYVTYMHVAILVIIIIIIMLITGTGSDRDRVVYTKRRGEPNCSGKLYISAYLLLKTSDNVLAIKEVFRQSHNGFLLMLVV